MKFRQSSLTTIQTQPAWAKTICCSVKFCLFHSNGCFFKLPLFARFFALICFAKSKLDRKLFIGWCLAASFLYFTIKIKDMIKHMFFIVLVLFFYNASAQKDYYPPRQKILSLKEIEEKKVLEKKLTTYEFEKLVRLIKPYQKLPPFVQFHTSGGRNVIDKERQDSFLFSSKLPSIPAEFEWKKNHSIDEAMDIYGKYCEENKTHPYLDVYQQYYGWLLMTRYDMLSDTSKQNMDNVALLIGNMIDVKYKGYQLLYYSLAFLKTSTHNEKKVKEFATAIEQYGALDTSYVNAQLYLKNPSKTGNRFMDEAFGKYYTQLLENKKGLDAIIEMNK